MYEIIGLIIWVVVCYVAWALVKINFGEDE
jgi:hypothetical protein